MLLYVVCAHGLVVADQPNTLYKSRLRINKCIVSLVVADQPNTLYKSRLRIK